MEPVDIVVIEGFKRTDYPKIEVRRTDATRTPRSSDVPGIVAIASDHAIADATVPVLDLADIGAIADFVVAFHSLELPDAQAQG